MTRKSDDQIRAEFTERTGIEVGTILSTGGEYGTVWMVNELYVAVGGGLLVNGARIRSASDLWKTHFLTRLPRRLSRLQIIGHRDRPDELPYRFRPLPKKW